MNYNYRAFFGLNKEPFGTDIRLSEILKTPELIDVKDRFDYVIRLGAIGLVTGEVGSGKSTALRYALEKLHPSEIYNCLLRLYYGILPAICRCPGYSSFK